MSATVSPAPPAAAAGAADSGDARGVLTIPPLPDGAARLAHGAELHWLLRLACVFVSSPAGAHPHRGATSGAPLAPVAGGAPVRLRRAGYPEPRGEGAMRGHRSDLRARQAALVQDVAALLRERGAAEGTTPGQAISAGLLTLGELDLLAQQHGLRVGPGGRITAREDPAS